MYIFNYFLILVHTALISSLFTCWVRGLHSSIQLLFWQTISLVDNSQQNVVWCNIKLFLITKIFWNANNHGGERLSTCWNLLRNKWKQPAVIWLLIFKQVLNCRSGSIDQNNACTKVTIRFLKRNTKFTCARASFLLNMQWHVPLF